MLLAAGLLAGCRARDEGRVDASRYRSFFLWSGVRAPDYLAQADSVYVLWGELRRGDPSRIAIVRRDPPRDPGPALWLVVRAERLDWGEDAWRQFVAEAGRWQRAERRFAGVQVDFDASTLKLGRYAAFLRDARRRLPASVHLSATGLMDWTANAPADDLASLSGVVDEVVVQTYQGRATIPGYERYLPSLARLRVPYRIGLVEGGEWSAPAALADDPDFKGYVVFLDGSRGVT